MAEETKSESTSQPAAGGGKLASILAIVNLLVTLGIGAVVFIQFQKDKKSEHVSDIDADAPVQADAGATPKKEDAASAPVDPKATPSAPKVIQLDQFTVNLSTSVGTPPRFARVIIAVEVPSDEVSVELNQKIPQARNAIIDLFNSKRPSDLQSGEGRNALKDEIRNALNSFLVSGKVKAVFFSNFTIST